MGSARGNIWHVKTLSGLTVDDEVHARAIVLVELLENLTVFWVIDDLLALFIILNKIKGQLGDWKLVFAFICILAKDHLVELPDARLNHRRVSGVISSYEYLVNWVKQVLLGDLRDKARILDPHDRLVELDDFNINKFGLKLAQFGNFRDSAISANPLP